jgi:hypothetical protein
VLALLVVLGSGSAGAQDFVDSRVPDDLFVHAVRQLIAVEKAPAICAVDNAFKVPASAEKELKRRDQRYCDGSIDKTFIIGPIRTFPNGQAILVVKPLLTLGGCPYPLKRKGASWSVEIKKPCFVMD